MKKRDFPFTFKEIRTMLKKPLLPLKKAWPLIQAEERDNLLLNSCENLLSDVNKIPLFHTEPSWGLERDIAASYSQRDNVITIVERGYFRSSAAYYFALFHEIAHSTGHVYRLDRQTLREWHTNLVFERQEETTANLCALALVLDGESLAFLKVGFGLSLLDKWARKLSAKEFQAAYDAAVVAYDYLYEKGAK